MISLFYEDTLFRINNTACAENILKDIAVSLNLNASVEIIFCSDRVIEQINAQYLSHYYPTDIITFIAGADFIQPTIFISVDTVATNAGIYQESFLNELFRVIVHGFLHLAGYNDSTEIEKLTMRNMEDNYLDTYFQLFHVEQLKIST